jgi:hypothetical protein
MNANLLLERWRIGKRIESGGYLRYKFTVAESLSQPISHQSESGRPETLWATQRKSPSLSGVRLTQL